MPTVHTRYVTWISRGRRGHGSASQDIIAPLTTIVPSGGTYGGWAAPSITWSDSSGSHTDSFAFWSVTGAADGASISTNSSLSITVGGSDVAATAWYLPTGGNGTGGPGIFVDAFDVNLGDFSDADFVNITSDPTLTVPANNTGWVPTTVAETVVAYTSIDAAVPFSDWMVFVGTEAHSAEQLTAAQGKFAVAFAFYQSPTDGGFKPPREPGNVLLWVSYGVMVDAGGPTSGGPVPPWGPLVREFAAGLALAEAARYVSPDLRSSVLDIASKQVTLAGGAIAKQMQGGGG